VRTRCWCIQRERDLARKSAEALATGRVFFAPGSTGFDATKRVVALAEGEAAARWLEDLCALHEAHGFERELSGPLLQAILVRLCQIEQRQANERALHPSVARAMKYLEDNLAASPTMAELAQAVHMSPSHLRDLFRRQVGSSPMRYQNDLRMQRALRLLEQPHLSLPQIARACGFRDVEYFARRFRQYHRLPPGQMRRFSKAPRQQFRAHSSGSRLYASTCIQSPECARGG
jgi:AraC-like DNA-binding protein